MVYSLPSGMPRGVATAMLTRKSEIAATYFIMDESSFDTRGVKLKNQRPALRAEQEERKNG